MNAATFARLMAAFRVDQDLANLKARTLPTADNRKIVIFGSSVAAGFGSTGNNTGWAKLLADDLTPLGYTVVNKSVPSNATTDLINRFYADVVPELPDTVVIALSLANEDIIVSADKQATYTQYVNNIHRLVAMVRKIGARPIIGGTYPNSLYTAVEYAYCKQFDAEMEAAGIPLLPFMGTLDDGTGKWRAGTFADTHHPNNTGHLAMTRAIPRSLFARLPDGQDAIGRFDMRSDRAVQLGADTSTNAPIIYTPDYALGSFTVLARVRRPSGAAANKPVISLFSSAKAANSVRVLAPADAWVLQGASALVTSSRLSSAAGFDLLGITYDTHSDILRLWVNGVLVGADTASASLGTVAHIAFGGLSGAASANAVGYQFQDIGIWRTALNAEQMAEAARGEFIKGGLEVLAPCWDADVSATRRFVNLASSASALIASSASWSSVSGFGDMPAALAERPVATGSPSAINTMWSGTQAQYDAIGTKSDSTLYFITA